MPEKSNPPKVPKLVPKFATEAEEARWWFENRKMVEKEFRRAMRSGTVRHGTAQKLIQSPTSRNITIRMPIADIDRARVMAEKKGLGYQTYMKMLLREALDREARRGA